MERNNSTKIIAIVALFITVVGLSIGFSAFSNNLIINSSANITPKATDFDVNFSISNVSEQDGNVLGIGTNDSIGDTAVIDNSDSPTITGLKAYFTEPGQKVTYSFYAHNAGNYVAYLNSIVYENVLGETSSKVCTAVSGTDLTLMEAACDKIRVTVNVGQDTYTETNSDISNHLLSPDHYEEIIVSIEYVSDTSRADGDFKVAFGNIALNYGTVD